MTKPPWAHPASRARGFDQASVLRRFHLARVRAERHMATFESNTSNWKEETITDLLLAETDGVVTWRTFTRSEESRNGADWLWWWADPSGESFGMLVQAKRLWHRGRSWSIDFGYPGGSGRQMASLSAAARDWSVPPVYALYVGTHNYREHRDCRADHDRTGSLPRRSTLSVLHALAARMASNLADPWLAIDLATPLEDLVDPSRSRPHLWQEGIDRAPAEVAAFLSTPQSGARAIARAMVDQLAEVRFGQFGQVAEAQGVVLNEDSVFPQVPDDVGHFGVPYYANVLQGLRRQLPPVILDVLNDQASVASLGDSIEGLVVVGLPESRLIN